MRGWRTGLAVLALLAWAAGDGAAADTRTGQAAFKRGDFKTAIRELKPEAKRDDAEALYTLGRMHYAGLGVTRDAKAAAELFRRAAELGHAGAQYEYGNALALGEGVEQDISGALKWLMIAARAGNEDARETARQLGKYMPRGVIAGIRRQAAEWEVGK